MNILYTTHCPKCKILKEKLKSKDIPFVEVDDVEIMIKNGIDKVDGGNVPVFEYEGIKMSFITTIEWLKNKGEI